MKEAIANLAHSAKKSFGLSVLLLFIMFASAHAQTVDKDNARIDTLITKICKSVAGLKGIATATPADVQILSDYASIGLKYTVYSTEFQKIQTACLSSGINILPVDRLLPRSATKIAGRIGLFLAADAKNPIMKKAGITENDFFKASDISKIKVAIAKLEIEKTNALAEADKRSGDEQFLFKVMASRFESVIVNGMDQIKSLGLKEQSAQLNADHQALIKEEKAALDKSKAFTAEEKAALDKSKAFTAEEKAALDKLKATEERVRLTTEEAKNAAELARSLKTQPH